MNSFWIQFFLPLFWAIGFFLSPLDSKKTKIYSLIGSIVFLAYSIKIIYSLPSLDVLTEIASIALPNFFGITYTVAIDGLSAVLILLNAFLLVISVLATWNYDHKELKLYHFAMHTLIWAVNGSLVSVNLFMFYIFWEAMLIPLFILVGVFGGPNRKYASMKFFIYTAAGSILMLAAMFYMSSKAFYLNNSYDLTINVIKSLNLPFDGLFSPQALVFWAFCIAFFIKVPVFPFHSWLPDAHVEAPTAGSILLAGVLLKLGIYGLLRFVIPLFPEAVNEYSFFIIILGAIGIIYGALTALAQKDIKKVVAFSSISHMGYIVAGCFALNEAALTGAIFQMISHGLTTGGLFIAVHTLYVRRHTKEIVAYGGVASVMPLFAVMFFLMLLGSMAVPLTNGFVGEFLVIIGIYQVDILMAAIAAIGVILCPVYLLTLYQKVMYGEVTIEENKGLKDISIFEAVPYALLAIFIIYLGVYPNALIEMFKGPMLSLLAK